MLRSELFTEDVSSDDEMTLSIEQIAEAVHEANRAYCLGQGDHSQPIWEECSEDVRTGTLDGVMFHLDNPTAGADASHENWMKHKTDEGWTYGETKSEADKTHPSLVAFNDLPEKEKVKDYLFECMVRKLSGFK
jgi:hypothetical protein